MILATALEIDRNADRKKRRWMVWLKFVVFGAVIGTLPFCASAYQLFVDGHNFTLPTVIGKGQLYLLSLGVCAAALGELLGCGLKARPSRALAGFACVVLLVWSGACYGLAPDQTEAIKATEMAEVFQSLQRDPSKIHDPQIIAMMNSESFGLNTDKDAQGRIAYSSLCIFVTCVLVCGFAVMLTEE